MNEFILGELYAVAGCISLYMLVACIMLAWFVCAVHHAPEAPKGE